MPVNYPPDLTLTADVPSQFDADAADQVVVVGRVRYAGRINSVEFVPGWTRAGANSNYRTLNLYNRGAGGAGSTVVATLALTAGVDLTKYVAKTIPITAANAAVSVGDILEWNSIASGTGAPSVGGKAIVQQAMTS